MPEFIVLGAGPAGLFAADWISRNVSSDVLVVGTGLMGMVGPTEIDGRRITILPIFPQRGQDFPEIDDVGPDLAGAYAGTPGAPVDPPTPAPGSYAARALRDFAPISLSLAWKQFGSRVFYEPLVEVQRKVERSYHRKTGDRPSRIGYICGESPYAHELRRMIRRLRILKARPTAISDDSKVLLDDHSPLSYRRVINTMPLPAIARVLDLSHVTGSVAPARFVLADISRTEPSRLVYDVAPESPVFRVLTPCPDIAVIQLSLAPVNQPLDLANRVEGLLECKVKRLHREPFTYSSAYPLEPFSSPDMDAVSDVFNVRNIINLGRFAEWRYIDLNEISWKERLGCL
jgi:hypothetical protein